MNRARKTELKYHTAPVEHQLTDNAGPENVGPSVRGWKMQQDQHFMNSSYSVVFGHGNTIILWLWTVLHWWHRGCRGGIPTAVQAWRPCSLWEPSPSHPIL